MDIDANRRGPRKPGRPPRYIFEEPDDQLTPEERKRKTAIIKRRIRQNKAYHRRRATQNKLRANHPANAQVVPDPPFQTLQIPIPPHLHSPSLHPWPHDAPRVIPDFSQNPLELLASSASGTTNTTQTHSFSHSQPSPSSSLHPSNLFVHSPHVVDTSPSPKSELATSIPEPDAVSIHPVLNRPTQTSSSFPAPVSSEQPVPIEIDATANHMDLFSIPFSIDPQSDQQDSTSPDDLVNALVSAQEFGKSPPSLKDAMDRESDLLRMTGIKNIVFDNLRTKYASMHPSIQSALRLFVIFPNTFELTAALSVGGLQQSQSVEMQGMLELMMGNNFIREVTGGRYALNDPARLFLTEDETVFKDSLAADVYQTAQKRFVKHFQTQLSKLQNEQIHKVGWLREGAMAWYDTERENVVYSEFLLEDKRAELREFLSAGITVMRYCESAAEREKTLLKALRDDETSTEQILMPFGSDNPVEETSSAQPDGERDDCDRSNRARLELALSEAYFDQLKTAEAEKPLVQSLELMLKRPKRCLKSKQSGVVELVLALLLLSNLRLGANKTEEAHKLCSRALSTLRDATLGRSTFGINAMSNLVTIYLREGELGKAKSVAGRLLDTLNTMRYTGMPIYADALGVCGMVSMAEGNYAEAERQYLTALETVGKWGSKDWAGVPVQHCLDLDLWLMEGLAEAYRKQGRIAEALDVSQRATAGRESRGLPKSKTAFEEETDNDENSGRKPERRESDKTLRHLY